METTSQSSADLLASELQNNAAVAASVCEGILIQLGTTAGSCTITNVSTTTVTRRLSHERGLQSGGSTLWVVVVDYLISMPVTDPAKQNMTLPHMKATKEELLVHINEALTSRGQSPLLSLDPVTMTSPETTRSDGAEITTTQKPLPTVINGDATATTSTIAGIIIGFVVLLLLCYVLYYCKKRHSGENPNDRAQENNAAEETPAAVIAPAENAEVVDPVLESDGEAPVAVQDVIVGHKANAKQIRV